MYHPAYLDVALAVTKRGLTLRLFVYKFSLLLLRLCYTSPHALSQSQLALIRIKQMVQGTVALFKRNFHGLMRPMQLKSSVRVSRKAAGSEFTSIVFLLALVVMNKGHVLVCG